MKLQELDEILMEHALGEYWTIKSYIVVVMTTLFSICLTDNPVLQIGTFFASLLFVKNIEAIEIEILCFQTMRSISIHKPLTEFTIDDTNRMIDKLNNIC